MEVLIFLWRSPGQILRKVKFFQQIQLTVQRSSNGKEVDSIPKYVVEFIDKFCLQI